MLGLPLAFTAPLVLASLALLPLLWYLLRITPPRPKPIAFPPLKLILDLQPKEDTPARTPWWLLLMRLLLAAAIILAMAGPVWNPRPVTETGKGPLLVIVDDGWPAAVQWNLRVSAASEAIASAARQGRASAVAAVSEGVRDIAISDPAKATERLRAMKPVPYTPERPAALTAVRKFLAANPQSDVLWIADGVAAGNARGFAEGLIDAAGDTASVRVLTASQTPLALGGAQNAAGALDVRVLRAGPGGMAQGQLRAYDLKGLPIGETRFAFTSGNSETSARFELPVELRNEIARIEIDQEHSAGAVTLLDSRAKRRRVAIVTGVTADVAQPLLSPSYYVTRALGPYADVREPRAGTRDPVSAALDDHPSVLVLADVGVVSGPAQEKLRQFIDEGGVLLRFAGSRLAASTDEFVPVRLRRGGRVLGGSLSWDTPRRLAPFDRDSPFYGLPVSEEVAVTRQVLAEPEAGLPGKTWAALEDGTPMVTAMRSGKGMMVLVHVTADTTWSNLPLSGLFVDMLRRIVAMSGESATGTDSGTASGEGQVNRTETAAPTRTLDGFGVLGTPPVTAKPIQLDHDGIGSADHPPGFYGPLTALIAVNTLSPQDKLEAANFSGLRLESQALRPADPIDLRPWLIALAFTLYLADALASIWLGGGLAAWRRGRKVGGAAVAGGLLLMAFAVGQIVQSLPASAQAQYSPSPFPRQPDFRFPGRVQAPATLGDIHPALVTRLAYAVTGDARVDEASRVGLLALSRALAARTALTPGDPMGVNPAKDELTFFPLIYWPIVASAPQPSPDAVARISNFMKQGGTIVFDTRDAMTSRPGEAPTPETQWLRTLLAGVDVPELEVVPRDHVVTKTFYLLDNFVGRTTVGQTWIEALPPPTEDPAQRPARAGDSVSPIIITSNDLAAAWAIDTSGQPLYPLIPGTNRQREMAIRGGVNLVMYTLTGNYKSDQVHVRDLLERLGH